MHVKFDHLSALSTLGKSAPVVEMTPLPKLAIDPLFATFPPFECTVDAPLEPQCRMLDPPQSVQDAPLRMLQEATLKLAWLIVKVFDRLSSVRPALLPGNCFKQDTPWWTP